MNPVQHIRNKQTLRQAEGYLELITLFADRWPCSPPIRDSIGRRVLETLDNLSSSSYRRATVFRLRGQTLRVMNRFQEALAPLREAARLDRDNCEVWLALGWCYKRLGRLDLAIESLEEALEPKGSSGPDVAAGGPEGLAIVHYNIACYWALAGNAKIAAAYLGQAFDLDPDYRDLVDEESDFDGIRNHAEFLAVTSVIV